MESSLPHLVLVARWPFFTILGTSGLLNTLWTQDWIKLSSIIVAIATTVYTVITIFLFVATRQAADAARKSAEVTRSIFESSNRPYLGICEQPAEIGAQTKELVVRIIIKNYGAVPAKISFTEWYVRLDGHPKVARDNGKSQQVVLPGVAVALSKVGLSPREVADVLSSKACLEAGITIDYAGYGGSHYSYREMMKFSPDKLAFVTTESQST